MQVNRDGVLSFRQDLYYGNPESFPLSNDVLIAPFWDDVIGNNYYFRPAAYRGDVLYRLTTDKSVLDEIATNISSAFGVDFTPVTAFIVTWDGMQENPDYYYFYFYNNNDDEELVSMQACIND